jgi:hypothetical protein
MSHHSTRLHAPLAVLLACASALLGGCLPYKVTVPGYVQIDPNAGASTLTTDVLGRELTIPLVGGFDGRITVNAARLFTTGGVFATIEATRFALAGESVEIANGFGTGTICARENPDDATVGAAWLRPIRPPSYLNLHAGIELGGQLLQLLVPGGLLPFAFDADSVPFRLDYWKLLFLSLDGLASGTLTQEGTFAEDVPFLGGKPYRLVLHLQTTGRPAAGPLLDECDDLFATRSQ